MTADRLREAAAHLDSDPLFQWHRVSHGGRYSTITTQEVREVAALLRGVADEQEWIQATHSDGTWSAALALADRIMGGGA